MGNIMKKDLKKPDIDYDIESLFEIILSNIVDFSELEVSEQK